MNNSKPIFSVVMPMYNVERYVAQAIDSVLAQTYEHFELICVNDGCTDDTLRIVAAYDDSRIKVVHQKNMGLAAARNTGINYANGVFVALLDSDDAWRSNKLSEHFKHFRNTPDLDISYSASRFMDEDGVDMGIGQYPQLNDITPQVIFCRNPIGNGSAAVIRKSLLTNIAERKVVDGAFRTTYFDEDFRQSEDVEFWLRAALKTDCVFGGIGEALTQYRVNASGLSANLDNQFAAWKSSVNKNQSISPVFFSRWESLAEAYQKRYLARRAVQARNSFVALKLVCSAVATDWRIVKQEPVRTAATFGCAVLSVLPTSVYAAIEHAGMMTANHFRKSEAA